MCNEEHSLHKIAFACDPLQLLAFCLGRGVLAGPQKYSLSQFVALTLCPLALMPDHSHGTGAGRFLLHVSQDFVVIKGAGRSSSCCARPVPCLTWTLGIKA